MKQQRTKPSPVTLNMDFAEYCFLTGSPLPPAAVGETLRDIDCSESLGEVIYVSTYGPDGPEIVRTLGPLDHRGEWCSGFYSCNCTKCANCLPEPAYDLRWLAAVLVALALVYLMGGK